MGGLSAGLSADDQARLASFKDLLTQMPEAHAKTASDGAVLLDEEGKVAGQAVTPSDHRAAARLARYWERGEGAAKIRWGTDGDFTRCVALVVKHAGMTPEKAKGYCAKRHKGALGYWPGERGKPGNAPKNPARRDKPGKSALDFVEETLGKAGEPYVYGGGALEIPTLDEWLADEAKVLEEAAAAEATLLADDSMVKAMNDDAPEGADEEITVGGETKGATTFAEADGLTGDATGGGGMEHKVVPVVGQKVLDEKQGIVETIVSVTGHVDEVKDNILPGAYAKTLAGRNPKGVWSHSWETPVSKTLAAEELMPGHAELPKTQRNGDPWPAGAGGLKIRTQFNLDTQRGREAFSDVVFFGDEQEWSIGYQVPTGGAKMNPKTGVREISHIELYEYSPVLFGAMPLAATQTVKSAQTAFRAVQHATEIMEGGEEKDAHEWLTCIACKSTKAPTEGSKCPDCGAKRVKKGGGKDGAPEDGEAKPLEAQIQDAAVETTGDPQHIVAVDGGDPAAGADTTGDLPATPHPDVELGADGEAQIKAVLLNALSLEEKAGRVLSNANAAKLKAAWESIESVLRAAGVLGAVGEKSLDLDGLSAEEALEAKALSGPWTPDLSVKAHSPEVVSDAIEQAALGAFRRMMYADGYSERRSALSAGEGYLAAASMLRHGKTGDDIRAAAQEARGQYQSESYIAALHHAADVMAASEGAPDLSTPAGLRDHMKAEHGQDLPEWDEGAQAAMTAMHESIYGNGCVLRVTGSAATVKDAVEGEATETKTVVLDAAALDTSRFRALLG